MVLLEVRQLLRECFQLDLEVSPAQGQLIQDPSQAIDVGIHTLVKGQFTFVP